MSEPKRYIFRIRECGCVKPEHLEGKYAPSALIIEETEEKCGWVGYEDYARLKAEVERLTEAWVDKKMQEDRDALLQQVERLTKAGDSMAELMFIDKDYIGSPKQEAVVEWCKATEAKEGKPRA
jgi:hypothetical protein